MKYIKLVALITIACCALFFIFSKNNESNEYPHFSDIVESPLKVLYISISGTTDATHWYVNYIELNSVENTPLEEDFEISPFSKKDLKFFEKLELDALYISWDKWVEWNNVRGVINHLPKGKTLYLSSCPGIDLSFLQSNTSYSEIHFSNGIDVSSFQPNNSISSIHFASCFNIPWAKVIACSNLDTISYHTGEILPSNVFVIISESSVNCLRYYHPYDLWDQTDLEDRLSKSLYPPYQIQSTSEVPKWLYEYWNYDDVCSFFSREDRIIELFWLMNN